MGGLDHFWNNGDPIARAVAGLLLLMSIAAWVAIFWKGWYLRRVRLDLARAIAAFWTAESVAVGVSQARLFDREGVLSPMLAAVQAAPLAGAVSAGAPTAGPLVAIGAQGPLASRLTRHLRDALHAALVPLQAGQVMLASIGSTAPFIGLFGTVWGIYHALASISAAGAITIERVSGPVGEALVMTAAGLAVAIPAVLAYNVFGKQVGACEVTLEGFAHDLRELLCGAAELSTDIAPKAQ